MNKKRKYLALCLPAVLLMVLFIAVPLVNGIKISFYKWNGYSQNMRWVGFQYYGEMLKDKYFWFSLRNTMIYGFGSTFLQNVCGLAIAIFLNSRFKGRNGVRAIVYLPIMISAFLMGKILYFFIQKEGGVFNEMLMACGLEPVYWMRTGLSAVAVVTLANSWQYLGLCMIIYLAGLQGVPAMYGEAAELDGASRFQRFHHITLPLLIPAITTAVVTNLIGGFKQFDVVAAMSKGGPNRGSMSLAYYISSLYFNDEKAGYSAAVGVAMFFLIMLVTFPVNACLRKKEVEY